MKCLFCEEEGFPSAPRATPSAPRAPRATQRTPNATLSNPERRLGCEAGIAGSGQEVMVILLSPILPDSGLKG